MDDEWGWSGGEWWQYWPPPPDDDDSGYYEGFTADEDWHEWAEDIPDEPLHDDPLDGWDHPDERYYNVLDYLVHSIDEVDPKNVRGIGFASAYEALSWLDGIGVLGFSRVIEIGGLYHPVIGPYGADDLSDPSDDQGIDDDSGGELLAAFLG